MPIRIVLKGLRVQRLVNGVPKNIIPRIGQPFEFTAKEIQDLERYNPSHIRHPMNEDSVPVPALPVGPSENIDKAPKPTQDRIPDVSTGTGQAKRPGVSISDTSDL